MKISKILLVLSASVCFISPAFAQKTIQIKGSDTMVNLGQAWAEKYMEKEPNDFIAVTGGGSGTGISSLISGTCDIAMSSRDIKKKEIDLANQKGVFPNQLKVGLDGLAIVVNPKNTVEKLTIDQLADIFTGKIQNWKDVGGKDEKIVVLSREVNSGTHVYFKEHVLRHNNPESKEEFTPGALMLSSSQAIADEVATNPSSIGYYGMGYISPKQKAVSIAAKGTDFVSPTIQNVIDGHYPISRPLYLITNGQPQSQIGNFIQFVLSDEGQQIVQETDFVPINK
jgi:phosphate transport system substrate-binding protein